MKPIIAIAHNTFRESIRDRLLYAILFFGLLLMLATIILGSISLEQDVKVIKDLGLAGIFIINFLIILSVGTNLVSKEIDRKSIYTVLTKPIERSTFIIGKFFGLAATLFVTTAIMSAVFVVLLLVKHAGVSPLIFASLVFTYIELLFLVAIALMFSSFTAPVASALYTLAFFLIGHSMTSLTRFGEQAGPFVRGAITAGTHLLPNLEKFNIKNQVVYDVAVSGPQALWTVVYAVAYITVLIIVATNILKRQEF